jgi:hypothetical protein
MRGVHHRLVVGAANADVVAIEADVDVAEGNRLADELGHQIPQPGAEHGAATVDSDDRDTLTARLLDDLVCDAHQRAPHVFAVQNRLLAHFTAPSWPLRTWLKEPGRD